MKNTHRLVLGAAVSLLLSFVSSGCNREAKAERKITQAQEAFAKNDYATAEIEFKNALDLEPGHPQALKGLGLIWVRQGMTLDGGRMLAGAKSKLQKDDEVGVNLAQAMLEIGIVADCRKELLEVLDRSPGNGDALMLLAESSFTPEALTECVERIARSNASDQAPVLLASALVQLRRGEIEAGTKTVERVLQIDPNFARGLALQGRLLGTAKQPDKALEAMKKAAAIAGPRSAENIAYASYLMGLKRQDEALAMLKEATRIAPDYLPSWRTLGQIALTDGKNTEAAEYLAKVLAKAPVDLEAGILQAQIWMRSKEAPKAVELLEKVNQTYPSRPMLELTLGKAYLAANDFLKAADVLDRLLANAPQLTEAVLLRAGLHLKNGQALDAIRLVEPLYAAEPGNRTAQEVLVGAYRLANRADDAAAILKRQVEAKPNEAKPQLELGQMLVSQGKADEARAVFERVLATAPDEIAAVTQLVVLDQREGKSDAALARIESFLGAHPDSHQAHVVKAGLCYARKDLKSAETSATKAIELKPDETAAYGLLVRIQIEQGRSEEAVGRLKQLLEASPSNVSARMYLATLLRELGRIDEARSCFMEVLKIDPNFGPVYNDLAYIDLGIPGKLEQALEFARKAHALLPDDPAVSDTYGWIEWLLGNYRKALPLLAQAANRLPEEPTVRYHLAMAHYMMHQTAEATTTLEKALAIEGVFPEKEEATAYLAILREGGQLDLAALETRLKEKPKDVVLMILMGKKLAAAGKSEDALAAYQSALAVNPDLEAAYLGQADLYDTALKQPEKALEAANQARKVAPQSAQAAAMLGGLSFRAGNFQQAFELLQEAARKLPEDSEVQYDAGWAAFSVGRIDDARSAMGKVAESVSSLAESAREFLALTAPDAAADPAMPALVEKTLAKTADHVPALMVRAANQLKSGENPVETFEKILAVYPQFDPARIALARIYLDDPKQLEAAEKLATEARERLKNDPELGGILAIVNFRKGQFDIATQLLSELALKRPLSGRELFALGISQAATKRPIDARESLNNALKSDLPDADAAKARTTLEELDKADVEK